MAEELRTPFRDSVFFDPYKRVAFVGEYAWWRLRGSPQPKVPHLVKQRALTHFAKEFNLQVLVEGGTNLGNMINVQKNRFREIYSVERDDYLAARAAKKFAPWPHIHLFHGDSGRWMPNIVEQLKEPALFWLDAHWGAESAPIRAELECIYAHPIKSHVLLIDDARYFTGQGDYPSIPDLRAQASREYAGSVVESADDIIRIYTPKK